MPLIDLNGLGHFKDKENAMIANDYSASSTYAVGDYVFYNGTLYKCKTAITTAEAWTSGHWEAAVLTDAVSELNTNSVALTSDIYTGTLADFSVYLSKTNNDVTNNGDGTYTLGTSDYGTIIFCQLTLSAGNYLLFGVPDGFSFLSTSSDYSTAFATNYSENPKIITISSETTCYVAYRINAKPSASFTITPFLYASFEGRIDDINTNITENAISINLAGMQDNILYPVNIPAGSKITMSTIDSTTLDRNTVYFHFYDSTKTFKGSLNFWSGNTKRVATLSSSWGDIAYIAMRTMSPIPTQLEENSTNTTYQEYITNGRFMSDMFPNIQMKFNKNIISVGHRGTEYSAPENTMPAFKNAFLNGFTHIETDIQETSDGYYILMHNETVDGTTDGTGNVADMTLAEIQALDAGSWFSEYYTGTRVPTLEEFLVFCRAHGITPVLDIKSVTNISDLVRFVKSYGFYGDKVVYVSGTYSTLQSIIALDTYAEVWLSSTATWTDYVSSVNALKNGFNKVALVLYNSALTDTIVTECLEGSLTLGVWTLTYAEDIVALNPYINIVISNGANPARSVYTNYQTGEYS